MLKIGSSVFFVEVNYLGYKGFSDDKSLITVTELIIESCERHDLRFTASNKDGSFKKTFPTNMLGWSVSFDRIKSAGYFLVETFAELDEIIEDCWSTLKQIFTESFVALEKEMLSFSIPTKEYLLSKGIDFKSLNSELKILQNSDYEGIGTVYLNLDYDFYMYADTKLRPRLVTAEVLSASEVQELADLNSQNEDLDFYQKVAEDDSLDLIRFNVYRKNSTSVFLEETIDIKKGTLCHIPKIDENVIRYIPRIFFPYVESSFAEDLISAASNLRELVYEQMLTSFNSVRILSNILNNETVYQHLKQTYLD